ncbi:MAG: hypothetical protein ACOY46_13675 [Bacillota bacterium]
MFKSFKAWVERVLEKPFYEAEVARAEILKDISKKNNTSFHENISMKLKQV